MTTSYASNSLVFARYLDGSPPMVSYLSLFLFFFFFSRLPSSQRIRDEYASRRALLARRGLTRRSCIQPDDDRRSYLLGRVESDAHETHHKQGQALVAAAGKVRYAYEYSKCPRRSRRAKRPGICCETKEVYRLVERGALRQTRQTSSLLYPIGSQFEARLQSRSFGEATVGRLR